ncbi:hypothetical protein LTR04_001092 [Oleoguttula sp. CCFEE 6159]|nr:hypothetical protein LTR04_001092 [Oleoguttula sp. CCFEE 6159]
MIFQDTLLQEGEAGGKKAAGLLQSAVMGFLESAVAELPSDTKIVTRIYANLKGLSDVCAKAGIVDNPSKAEGFMRGFTRGRTLFDFVDVGYGKDRADGKMTGGVPFEKELADLSFKKTKFQTLFRTTKIDIHQQLEFVSDSPPVTYSTDTFPSTLNQTSGLVAPQLTNGLTVRGRVHEIQCTPTPTRTASVASTATSSEWPLLATGTWAAVAKNAPPFVPGQSTLSAAKTIAQTSSAPTQIPRNRKGQRIDPSLKGMYDKDEVARIKKMKMCNVHFLRKECPYGIGCTHTHSCKPTASELETLKLVARMAPCVNGSGCDDPKCMYGHRCPLPVPTTGSARGMGCLAGENCKFSKEMHNMDLNIVRFTKAT